MNSPGVGRYLLSREIAVGGMASVHLGRMTGPGGFGKTVAIKRIHPQFAKDPEFLTMFLDEGRLTAGLTHPNIVMTLDVLEEPGEVFLVMEYVHGASLAAVIRSIQRAGTHIPPAIGASIIAAALHGLHAAHEAKSDEGEPLAMVHRDVSPQNILISVDGVAKIGDFGIAKAVGQIHSTSEGVTKGKQSYMAPEQALAKPVTARADVFAAGVVFWEVLVGKRLISGGSGPERLRMLLELKPSAPGRFVPGIPAALDDVVLRALQHDPNGRFPTARAMATAIEQALPLASASAVGEWLRATMADVLAQLEQQLAEFQRATRTHAAAPPSTPAAPNPVDGTTISANETGAAISTDRNLLSPHIWRERRTIALAAFLGCGMIGLVFLLTAAAARSSQRSAVDTAPANHAAEVALSAAPPPEPPPPPSAAPPPPAVFDSADPPAPKPVAAEPQASAPPTPAYRPASPPRPARSAHSGACHVVAQREPSGKMTFREVCGP